MVFILLLSFILPILSILSAVLAVVVFRRSWCSCPSTNKNRVDENRTSRYGFFPMPSFRIRDRNVFALMPSSSAAPPAP